MPEPIDTPEPIVPGGELGASNSQDFSDANDALDALLKQADPEPADPPADKPADPPADKPVVDPAKPGQDDKPADPPPADKPVVDPAKPGQEPAKDDFDKVELPPYTKPKSVEAFATVKQMARERIAAIEKEKADLTAKLTAAESAKSAGPDEAAEKELQELRDFRLKFDVEADPSFKSWDESVKENENLIYTKLRSSGVDEASIKRIQELGGPSQVDWESISSKFPPTLKRYIEGKVFENEDLVEKKKAAIEKAKENASEFVRTRQEEIYKGTEGRQKDTAAEFEAIRPNVPWLKEVAIDPKASAADKAKAEANNVLVKRVQEDIKEALTDDSPRMRAILIAGFAKLMHTQASFETLKATHATEMAALKASLKEKQDFIDRIKNSSTARLSSATPAAGTPRTKKSDINEDPSEVLDRHYKEALAKAE